MIILRGASARGSRASLSVKVSIVLLSGGQKALRFHQKDHLCSEDERKPHGLERHVGGAVNNVIHVSGLSTCEKILPGYFGARSFKHAAINPQMEFSEENVRIPFEQKELDGVFTVPADVTEERTAMVLTHGAGGDMHIKQLESLAHALARSGVLCLRFTCRAVNFPYRVRAYRAVVDYLRSHDRFAPDSIFLGGRSMGARTAVVVCQRMCRQKDVVQGVLCLSFPLNLPGKPLTYVERSRELRELSQTSVMFVSGTADNMCEQRLLQNIMSVMNSPSAVHWVKDANHGLKVCGRTEESVLEEVNPQIIAWVLQHK